MNKKRIAINGFGAIGRTLFRKIFDEPNAEIVAINDLADNEQLAYLLKHNSIYGNWKVNEILFNDNELIVSGHHIKVLHEPDISKLPWRNLNIDLVVESTGRFTNKEQASKHLKAGAKQVIISAPAKNVPTFIYGINEVFWDPRFDKVISNSSCAANCIAPVLNILFNRFDITSNQTVGLHAMTSTSNILDSPSKTKGEIRKSKAANFNTIPTGFELKDLPINKPEWQNSITISGASYRVPVIDGSALNFIFTTKENVSVDDVNDAIKEEIDNNPTLKNVIQYSTEELTSCDAIGTNYACIYDSKYTKAKRENGETLVNILLWYDNEGSFVSQLKRNILYMLPRLDYRF